MDFTRRSTPRILTVTTTTPKHIPIMSMDRKFDIAASLLMVLLGLSGVGINLFFFITSVRRKKYNTAYFKFCRTRAVANVIMATVFIVWAAPCTFLGFIFLPESVNGVAGQLAGWGAYIIGPFIQFCISVNRFIASYFPVYFRTWNGNKLTYITIGISIFIGAGYFSYGITDGCTFHFNVTYLSWLPEEGTCAWDRAYFIFYSIVALFIGASIMNLASFFILMKYMRAHHVSTNQTDRSRQRKNWSLLIQNIVQDSFFLIDLFAVTFAIQWYDEVWYQWFMNSALWLIHINADGTVMFISERRLYKLSPRTSGTAFTSKNLVSNREQLSARFG